ncbi:MAG TPA: ATP-binding cassette domain-containing protein [Candidatus Saccharimonadales bacterium]|jgi:ABC-type nitrate/sulfonate/bicarbonate transport system ATPase subunit|nr:ATP-binding cassette domain-containing protein [Candidatus Saccharimonadales bacterium]
MPPKYKYGDTLLKIDHVSLSYGDKVILRDVNAEIRDVIREDVTQGQVVGFLGPSGIGKTQMFRIIAGLNQATSGQVLVGPQQAPVKAGMVGVVAQDYPLFENRSIYSNLLLAAGQSEANSANAHEKVMDYLRRLDMVACAQLYPAQISGGQRQRIAIAQQLLCSDHFLLMDEPFSGLDVVMEAKVCELIAEIASLDELNTIIVVTHDVTAAASVADHLWLMGRDRGEKGEIVPGAHIVEQYDLIERDLCWHPEITNSPAFLEFVREVKERFHTL